MWIYATTDDESGDTRRYKYAPVRKIAGEESRHIYNLLIDPIIQYKPEGWDVYSWLEWVLRPFEREITAWKLRKKLKTTLLISQSGFNYRTANVELSRGDKFLIRDDINNPEYLDIEFFYDQEQSKMYKIERSKFKELQQYFIKDNVRMEY